MGSHLAPVALLEHPTEDQKSQYSFGDDERDEQDAHDRLSAHL